jgi:hypothetical protein
MSPVEFDRTLQKKDRDKIEKQCDLATKCSFTEMLKERNFGEIKVERNLLYIWVVWIVKIHSDNKDLFLTRVFLRDRGWKEAKFD